MWLGLPLTSVVTVKEHASQEQQVEIALPFVDRFCSACMVTSSVATDQRGNTDLASPTSSGRNGIMSL